jgi:heme iron utilization protein
MTTFHDAPSDRLSPILLGTAPSHAERARTLVEHCTQGTLCTLMATSPQNEEIGGFPYGSVVSYALDEQANPLLLTSSMAEHTRNFCADARASLFVHEAQSGDPAHNPLALGRVTLLGRIEAVEASAVEATRARYLARHAEARYYAGYRDFGFYRLRVTALRYIGGFGRMSWVDVAAYGTATADPIAPLARGIVDHMNQDHAEALRQLCTHPAGLGEVSAAVLRSVDRYGVEIDAQTPEGPRFVRLGFAAPVADAAAVRAAVIALLRLSRQATSTAHKEHG